MDQSISGDGGVWGLKTIRVRVWRHWNVVHRLLRLRVDRISSDTSYHASDAVLELTVRRGVDERIDAGADEQQYPGEVVEPESNDLRGKKLYLAVAYWRLRSTEVDAVIAK